MQQRNPERLRRTPSPGSSADATPTTSPRRDAPPPMTDDRAGRWPRTKAPPPAIRVPPSAHPHQGQQFTVGNVSHGMIYLRPVTRPDHERYNFVQPPSTPPSSADDFREARQERSALGEEDFEPPRTPTLPRRRKEDSPLANCSPPVPTKRHGRARAHSVAHARMNDFTAGEIAPQVRIDQLDGPPGLRDPRPHTTGNEEQNFQSLDVRIPHYNLGSPRFSPGGTPYMFGTSSVQASAQGEPSSSQGSRFDMGWLWPPRKFGKDSSGGSGDAITASINATIAPNGPFAGLNHPASHLQTPQPLAPSPFPDSCSSPTSMLHVPSPPIPQAFGPLTIDPSIYDRISFPPGCDAPSIVRYDSNGDILAATPTRIIVQITSAAFVDYHLLSDFFLTYRLFMNAQDLASHLLSRLKWAIDRGDDTGKVVRVRTFVALRHWILNYFPDDFVPSLPFRQEFASALNIMTRNLKTTGGPSDLKILGELKKCWRATCALYWDHVPADPDTGVDAYIHPGGPPGTRQEEPVDAAQQVIQRMLTLHPPPTLPAVNTQGLSLDPFLPDHPRPRSDSHANPDPPLSRRSDSISSPPGAVGRLRQGHKRSASFSDALRDHRTPLAATAARTTAQLAMQMTMPYAGSLVRGNMFPPTAPGVHVIAPPTPVPSTISSSTYPSTVELRVPKQRPGPGVKKMLVNMRKALGVQKTEKKWKDDAGAEKTGKKKKKAQLKKRSDSLFQAVLSGSELRIGTDGQQRVDLLGARSVEAFKRAMEASEDWRSRGTGSEMTEETGSRREEDGGMLDGVADGRTDMVEIGTAVSCGEMDGREEEKEEDEEEEEEEEEERGESIAGPMGELKRDFLDSSSSLATAREEGEGGELERGEGYLMPTSFLDDKSENGSSIMTREPSQQRSRSRRSLPLSPQQGVMPSERGTPSERDSTMAQVAALNNGYLSRSSSARSLNPRAMLDKRLFELRRSRSSAFERASRRFNPDIEPVDEKFSGFHSSFAFDKQSLKSARSFLMRNNSALSQYSIGMDNISELSAVGGGPKPVDSEPRGLRRRPGGNLRTAATVGELDEGNRRYSTGSIATSSYSMYATSELQSDFLRQGAMSPSTIASSRYRVNIPRFGNGMLSLGPMGGTAAAVTAPDSPTESSRPRSDETGSGTPEASHSRGSFEAGVQLLRDLPDDDSDMGVDVALAKLEGTYQRKSVISAPSYGEIRRSIAAKSSRNGTESSMVFSEQDQSTAYDGMSDGFDRERQERFKHRHKHIVDQVPLPSPSMLDGAMSSKMVLPSPDTLPIPEEVEKPGLTHATASSDALAGRVHAPSERSPEKRRSEGAEEVDLGRVDDELERVLGSRQTGMEGRDDISEVSTELSYEETGKKGHRPTNSGTIIEDLGIAAHPLRHPPSPPLTLSQAHTLSPRSAATPRTPHTHNLNLSNASSFDPPVTQSHLTSTSEPPTTEPTQLSSTLLTPTSTHLPFILSYDSLLLAQQLTLLEHSLLLDLDWHSLIHLTYPSPPSILTWSDLLSHPSPLPAITLTIARFNLMVRWTQSQILLTRDITERARTIIKLIHIAAHCRTLGNFATMAQLAVALCSRDVGRLKRTWELVPRVERGTLRELEALVGPTGNWAALRAEMEAGEGRAEAAVVPWVGLFTNDLILNASRPLWVPAGGAGEGEGKRRGSLVNFARCRVAAGTVKRLLRLVEAGARYGFEPVDGVAERCLWIAGLGEEEVKGLSKGIEDER